MLILLRLRADLKAHATSQGYVIVTKRTKRVGRRKGGDAVVNADKKQFAISK